MNIRLIPEWLSRRVVALTAGLTAVMGLLALGAWASGHWHYLIVGEHYVPMAANTAVLFLVLGLAMGASHRWPASRSVRTGATGAAVAAMAVSMLVTIQAWHYFPLPWDDWLTVEAGRLDPIPLGRMSPLTGLAFLSAASSLLILRAGTPITRLRRWNAAGLTAIPLLIGLIVLVGHAAGTPLLYGGTKVPMAWLTAANFVLFSSGLLAYTGIVPSVKEELREARKLKLVEGEMRLQSAALSAAANAIVITDRDGTIVWVNAAFTVLTGYTRAEAIRKNPRDLVKSGRQERAYYAVMWETILAGQVWLGEMINRRKDGTEYPEEMTITPVRGPAGEITHFIAVMQDLTERKKAEGALRREQALFARLIRTIPDLIWLKDPQGVFLACNPGFEKLYGAKEADIVGKTDFDFVDKRLAEVYREHDRGVMASAQPNISEAWLTFQSDGHRGQFETIKTSMVDGEGKLIGVLGIARNVTARKQFVESLRLSEERYRLLFENNPLSMWLYDTETLGFLAVNESAVRHYGYTRAEFLGMTIKDIRPPEDVPLMLESVAQDRTEARGTGAARHRRKDGTIIHAEIVSSPLVFEGRDARLVLANDVTEKKLLEEKFLHAQRLESIGMLAAGIAHDLNNVLAPIVFAAPMLRESLTAERDLRILDTLVNSAQRGAGLVKQILGFAHSTTGEFRPTQVKHLARDVIGLIEDTFPKNIKFLHEVPSALWPVLGDPTQIHQVILNLCVNARDAMPQGGTLGITAANRRLDAAQAAALPGGRPGDWLELAVSDTGSGIAPELLEKIWTPFFTTKAVGKGTGLGLTTIRSIVTSHHGFVTLDTAVGRGTTFRVFLPAVEKASNPQQGAAPFADVKGNGELILVVDDDAAIHNLVAVILGKFGYRVLKCADGLEAIDLFKSHSEEIALVVTDVDMPNLGGLALAVALRRLRPEILILAMSGLPHNDAAGPEIPAMRQLVNGFLPKPFKAEELLAALHAALHSPAIVQTS